MGLTVQTHKALFTNWNATVNM